MRRFSILSQITTAPLAKPCDVAWNAMVGNDRFRHCAACDKPVWNLSAMTAREAEIRLLNAPKVPCIQYRLDAAGALVSRPDVRATKRRNRTGAALFAGALQASGCGATANASPPIANAVATNAAAGAPSCANPPAPAPNHPAPTAPGESPPPSRPPPRGGVPPRVRQPIPAGTATLVSDKPRDVVIDGVTFHAPATIQLPPGKHQATFTDDSGRTAKRTFSVKLNATVAVTFK